MYGTTAAVNAHDAVVLGGPKSCVLKPRVLKPQAGAPCTELCLFQKYFESLNCFKFEKYAELLFLYSTILNVSH